MNKTELINSIAEKAEITKKDANTAIDAFMNTVKETLSAGESVHLVGFGTFDVSNRAARTGRNPKTGDPVEIAASKSPKFKASSVLKAAVNV